MPGGRPPGSGKVPGSGRKVGSVNRINDKVKGDLLAVYQKLGGRRFLAAYAEKNPDEFVKHLMRLVPVPRDEVPTVTINTGPQINADTLTDMQAASRIAFALASVAQQLEPGRVIEAEPVPKPAKQVKPPPPAPELTPPPPPTATEPASEPERQHFGVAAEQGTRRRNLL